MILCMPERVCGGDAKFQGFCDGWNKWEGQEYVQVLRLLETFDLEVLHGAVKDALRLGAIGYDAVKHLVLCRIERRPPKLDLI